MQQLVDKLKTIKKKEVLRFLVGGGSAVIIDFVTYRLMLMIGIDLIVAKAVSYILGAIVGFIINKLWTFESQKFSMGEILRYIVLYLLTAVANTLCNKLVLLIVAWEFFAFLCATGLSTILNFLGQKFFVFTKRKK